jgi:NADH-quinone oxidoreductase subunit L
LLPLLPLAGFLINGLLGRHLPRPIVTLVACGLPAAAFALALSLFRDLAAGGPPVSVTLYTWAATAGFTVDATLYFDRIAAVMCLVITGIGTLIHVYSVGYMHGDTGYARYFAYLNLFLSFMLLLVLGGNLVVLFIGWEGVGLASYLLIGFWFKDAARTAAGLKAFIVNRVGDTGFLLAAFLLQAYAGTLDFQAINAFFSATPPAATTTTLIALLLLVGACGKSAQIPLHVWLPDAMAGPTPVSALIHAATMVTAGVYLLSRLDGLFLAAPDAMVVVAWLGATTAIVGASMGVTEYNLKKVLAYSTMSQIGLMFMACGLGAFSVGLFHLTTHAFFKAGLFLAAGAVLHALHGEEDMRRMGALARRLPFTFAVFLLAALALCGLPPLAGFFSKDEILWMAWAAPQGSPLLWLVGLATSFITAFYMFRAISLTFFGADNVREARRGIHDPPRSMSSVLAALAFGSVVAGWIGLPASWRELLGVTAPFYAFLAPALGEAKPRADVSHATEWLLMVVAVLVAVLGILLAWRRYAGSEPAADAVRAPGALARLVAQGYYVDAFYAAIVGLVGWLSASVLRGVESVLRAVSITGPALGARAGARWFAGLQTGNLQAYVIYALVGLVLVIGWGAARA